MHVSLWEKGAFIYFLMRAHTDSDDKPRLELWYATQKRMELY